VTWLLDTHTFLWLAADPDKLSPKVRDIATDPANELALSAASGWEVALLWKLGRIELPQAPEFFVPLALQALGLTPRPIGFASAIAAATLPLHHRDPFDRLLVAEALREKLTVLTKDAAIALYGVRTLW